MILGVRDLDAAAERLRREHGLGTVAGGRHPGGTVNAVVPLEPPQYLELLAVEDPDGELGALAARALGDAEERLIGWAVAPDDLGAVAERLGIEPETGTIERPDGSTGQWTMVFGDLSLPFFIDYGADRRAMLRERYEQAGHTCAPREFTFLEVGGDRQELVDWLGAEALPLRFAGGPRGLRAVGIASEHGEIVIR